MNVFIQLFVIILLAALILSTFPVTSWQYWMGIVLVIANQLCFVYKRTKS